MRTETLDQALVLARQHHSAGRLAEAEALYRQVLAAQPDHSEALHSAGVLAHEQGRDDIAIELIGQAVTQSPNDARLHASLGEAYHAAGRPVEAAACEYRARELSTQEPESAPPSPQLSGHALANEAMAAYRRALEFKPVYAETCYKLGKALAVENRLDEAVQTLKQALEYQPDHAEACDLLGKVLAMAGRHEEATEAYRRASQLAPD